MRWTTGAVQYQTMCMECCCAYAASKSFLFHNKHNNLPLLFISFYLSSLPSRCCPPPIKRFELKIFRWAVLPPSQPTQKIDPRPYSRSKKPVFEWVVSCLSRKWTESRILSLDISKMTLRRYLLWALMNWNGSSSSPICSSSVIFKNPVIVHLMLFTSRMLKLIKSSWTGGR